MRVFPKLGEKDTGKRLGRLSAKVNLFSSSRGKFRDAIGYVRGWFVNGSLGLPARPAFPARVRLSSAMSEVFNGLAGFSRLGYPSRPGLSSLT